MIQLSVCKDYYLQAKIPNFKLLTWTRRYQTPSDFKLLIPATRENIEQMTRGNICMIGSNPEGLFIEDFKTMTAVTGEKTLEVTGRDLTAILDYRIIHYEKNDKASIHLNSLLRENLISPLDGQRKIPSLELMPIKLKNDKILDLSYEGRVLGDAVIDILEEVGAGIRCFYDMTAKKMRLEIYDGIETAAVFSENFRNIISQEYYERTSTYKNICYVKTETGTVEVGEGVGLNRREVYMTANNQSTESSDSQGLRFLKNHLKQQSFHTIINDTSDQFSYRKDWDLGDIVINKSDLYDITIRHNVLEVTEMYDRGGRHLSVTFGDLE